MQVPIHRWNFHSEPRFQSGAIKWPPPRDGASVSYAVACIGRLVTRSTFMQSGEARDAVAAELQNAAAPPARGLQEVSFHLRLAPAKSSPLAPAVLRDPGRRHTHARRALLSGAPTSTTAVAAAARAAPDPQRTLPGGAPAHTLLSHRDDATHTMSRQVSWRLRFPPDTTVVDVRPSGVATYCMCCSAIDPRGSAAPRERGRPLD